MKSIIKIIITLTVFATMLQLFKYSHVLYPVGNGAYTEDLSGIIITMSVILFIFFAIIFNFSNTTTK